MFKILKKSRVTYNNRKIMNRLRKHEIGLVRFRNSQEKARIRKDVRQGCTLSLSLFNLYVKESINRVREKFRQE